MSDEDADYLLESAAYKRQKETEEENAPASKRDRKLSYWPEENMDTSDEDEDEDDEWRLLSHRYHVNETSNLFEIWFWTQDDV